MDLLGDIVEHDVLEDQVVAPGPIEFKSQTTLKPSRWKQRLQKKGISSMSGVVVNDESKEDKFYEKDDKGLNSFKDSKERKLDYTGLNEKEQIHQENIEILSRMSLEERDEAKQELLDTLDPKILQMLMNRSMRKAASSKSNEISNQVQRSIDEPVEGSLGTWVGGNPDELLSKEKSTDNNNENDLKREEQVNKEAKPKKIRFDEEAKVIYINRALKVEDLPNPAEDDWEDVEDLNSNCDDLEDGEAPSFNEAKKVAEKSNKDLVNEMPIHFPKPTQPYEELDINDPNFNDKLYEKYFPDLPQNANQLDWMKSNNKETPKTVEYESLLDVRFDFKGDIVNSQNVEQLSKSNNGLFNHSQNPELPGYTLTELAHLLRSTYPGQCCVASRTLGRIMYKLGTLQYQIQEHEDEQDQNGRVNDKGTEGQFEIECWKLIHKLQIIELLQHYSSDKQRNLSIKNYAIDALWLWKQANGDENMKKYAKDNENKDQGEVEGEGN